MDWAYNLHGGTPFIRKYQVAASATKAGIPHLQPAANGTGLAQCTTTGAANMVGCNVDTGTYGTTQKAAGTETLLSFIINPDAVWKARLSGGATVGTALSARTATSATSSGLNATTGDDWSSPTMDEGTIWGYDGANAGQVRKITSVSSTAATVIVPFNNGVAIGDNFLYAPFTLTQANTLQLTTDLTEVDATIAVGTGGAFRPIEALFRDLAGDGKNNSFVLFVSDDHILNVTT